MLLALPWVLLLFIQGYGLPLVSFLGQPTVVCSHLFDLAHANGRHAQHRQLRAYFGRVMSDLVLFL